MGGRFPDAPIRKAVGWRIVATRADKEGNLVFRSFTVESREKALAEYNLATAATFAKDSDAIGAALVVTYDDGLESVADFRITPTMAKVIFIGRGSK